MITCKAKSFLNVSDITGKTMDAIILKAELLATLMGCDITVNTLSGEFVKVLHPNQNRVIMRHD